MTNGAVTVPADTGKVRPVAGTAGAVSLFFKSGWAVVVFPSCAETERESAQDTRRKRNDLMPGVLRARAKLSNQKGGADLARSRERCKDSRLEAPHAEKIYRRLVPGPSQRLRRAPGFRRRQNSKSETAQPRA